MKRWIVAATLSLVVPVAHGEVLLFGSGGASGDRTIGTIDTNTGVYSTVGDPGPSTSISALAYDAGSGTLYGMSGARSYTIDRASGVATQIGVTVTNVEAPGLAFDSIDGTLFMTDRLNDSLYSINTATGAETLIGANGVQNLVGLAFAAGTDTLYGISSNTNSLYSINQTSGVASLIGALGVGINQNSGLAYDDLSGDLFMSRGNTNSLYSINAATGLATLVGAGGTLTSIGGLAFAESAVPAPAIVALFVPVMLLFGRRRTTG